MKRSVTRVGGGGVLRFVESPVIANSYHASEVAGRAASPGALGISFGLSWSRCFRHI